MHRLLSWVWMPLCLAACAHAAPEPASPSAADILKRAAAAAKALKTVSYDSKFFGEGALAERLPKIEGKVVASRAPTGAIPRMRIESSIVAVGEKAPGHFKFAYDGEKAYRVDEGVKLFMVGPVADAKFSEQNALLPPLYLSDAPFKQELESVSTRYEGAKTVDGMECDVVTVQYDPAGKALRRFYFGKKDTLLRRYENIVSFTMPNSPQPLNGLIVFAASSLAADPKIDEQTFHLDCPDGYRKSDFKSQQPGFNAGQGGLIASGRDAPDFTLNTADGKSVTLKSLRGKIIVLDFWASWCGPCKQAMPGVQTLHERFKDRPVVVFGVNCRQSQVANSVDPMDYIKSQKFTYPQLLKGDDVATAYHIPGLPTFYVIDQDGKVAYAASGFQPALHESLYRFIEGLLKQKTK